MTIPKTVKIGGIRYRVLITENLPLGELYSGEIDYRDATIRIRPSAPAVMERTCLHELVHAMLHDLGYSEHEEKEVDELAGALYALIVNNPAMFAASVAFAKEGGKDGKDI